MKRHFLNNQLAAWILALAAFTIAPAKAQVLFSLDMNYDLSVNSTQSGWVAVSFPFTANATTTNATNISATGINFSLTTLATGAGRDRGGSYTTTPTDYFNVYRDFVSNVDFFSLTNLTPSTDYEIRVFSYDSLLVGTFTSNFTVTTGTGSGGSVSFTGTPPTTDLQYSLLMPVTSDASGIITLTMSGSAPRLNGLQLVAIPEPQVWAMLTIGIGAALMIYRRRRFKASH